MWRSIEVDGADDYSSAACRILPSPLDFVVARYCVWWLELGEERRAEVSAGIGAEHACRLLTFGERAADLGRRRDQPAWLVLGLVAIFIQLESGDSRDAVLSLTVPYFCANQQSWPFDALATKAIELCSGRGRDLVAGFLQLSNEERDPSQVGRVTGVDPEGMPMFGRPTLTEAERAELYDAIERLQAIQRRTMPIEPRGPHRQVPLLGERLGTMLRWLRPRFRGRA